MLIAGELRKNNIAEYLLYMWQIEDLIRSRDFDVDQLTELESDGLSDENLVLSIRRWYGELIDMMTVEGVRSCGHLQINNNVLLMLEDLHSRIMSSNGCNTYKQAYYAALPVIVGYRAKSDATDKNELESCFEMMYGVWMLKLQGRAISAGTADAASKVSSLLARLAAFYAREREEEIDFDEEE